MLHLPDVTLVCATSCCHELTALAVRECVRRVEFADVLLWSDRSLPGVETRHAKLTSVKDWDWFIWFEAWQHVKTSHFLVVQWDSWVTNPDMWTPDFLLCDYIGAPWWYRDGLNVGNSGFCLRSVQMARFVAKHHRDFTFGMPADVQLCRQLRPALERHGFAWADERLALRFSFECTAPAPAFGFHAFRNWPFVLEQDELEQRLAFCDERAFKDGQLEWFNRNRDLCRSIQPRAA